MSNQDTTRHRIVFKGEMSFEYDQDEVRENLRKLCRFDDAALDRLFSGELAVLKNNIDRETAQKYKAALDKTGAICTIEELPSTVVQAPPPAIELATTPDTTQTRQPAQSDTCPKCAAPRENAEVCGGCGLIFAKHARMLERQAAIERGDIPVDHAGAPTSGERDDLTSRSAPHASRVATADIGLLDRMSAYFDARQEQAFLAKALLTIIAILAIKPLLNGLFGLILFLSFPAFFLLYIRYQAATTNQSIFSLLREHITFMPVMHAEGEKKTAGATWVTYGVILLDILVFYGYELRADPEFLFGNLVFLPYVPNMFNVPISLITSIFLHGSTGHLWGNMIFLWAVGTVVEKRIGWCRFLLYYLVTGIMGNLLYLLVTFVATGEPGHALGASGAISGVMGIFAVRCYFKSMVFPLPILGIFSLLLPINFKVRLNSLVIIGLFFAFDLSDGIAQVAGDNTSHIAHWAHIGGLLCGAALAMLSKLGDEAIGERHVEIGRTAMSKGGNLYAGEESMRLALQRDPENAEVMLMLGQLLSKYDASSEGEELYRKGMAKMIQASPKEAMEAYRGYYERYMQATDPPTQLRLAALYQQANDYTWASRCLELLADNPSTPEAIRERAVFQCARIKELMGQEDIARHYYRLFVDTFPQSPMAVKVQARLGAR